MPRTIQPRDLIVLSFAFLGACGGGADGTSGSDTAGGTTPAQAVNPPGSSTATSAPATTTSSAAGTTSTTFPDTTTTTTASTAAVTTTSSLVSSTTTSSSVATTSSTSSTSTTFATTTTTASNTTTTANSNLPPLSGTPITLDGGPNGTLGVRAWSDGNTGSGGQGAPAGNAKCIPYDALDTNYFVHAHISIFRDGQRLALPQYIGMASTCLYEINTDNLSGVVDAFSSAYKRLTLGDLFAVWGQALTWNNIAGFSGQPVVIYVEDNGVLKQHAGDPGDIELLSKRSITIQIGARLTEIPVYKWDKYLGE
ncbi:hypothetical protein [Janthinobacterium sp. 17J80-10]|uniref:hypothetical protein n=1 Tax=Janthinobacterium sp. 17J80-10 TaxID=2497863 RepID=UPI001005688D|nr:hypothetical protein [Janthinobacterium sp. 17J80-10]QAU33587.1 hypothetical protein EKL02_04985 [Janthinobacterium sp. 17J80-10]